MVYKSNRQYDALALCAIYFSVCLLVFMLSMAAPWTGDEIFYQYSFATDEKVGSLTDILKSQWAHYLTINGRYIDHCICQWVLSMVGQTGFSVMNALMYIPFICLIVRFGDGRGAMSTLTCAMLVLLFVDIKYIPTCHIGYLWMATFVLAFVGIFFLYGVDRKVAWWGIPCFFILSVVVGNLHESLNVGFGGALGIYAIRHWRKVSLVQWVMLTGFFIGCAILCLSPGIIARAARTEISFYESFIDLLLTLRVTYVFVVILLYKLVTRSMTVKRFYAENAFFVNVFVIILVFNFMVGIRNWRQLFGLEMVSAIFILRLLKDHAMQRGWLAAFGVLLAGIYFIKFEEIKKTRQANDAICEAIRQFDGSYIYLDLPKMCPFTHPSENMDFNGAGRFLFQNAARYVQHCYHIEDFDSYQFFPSCLKDVLEKGEVKAQAIEYQPGKYVFVSPGDSAATFTLKRCVNVLGAKVPLPSVELTLDSETLLPDSTLRVGYAPVFSPYAEIVSVE